MGPYPISVNLNPMNSSLDDKIRDETLGYNQFKN